MGLDIEKMKNLREAHSLSQEQAARRAGWTTKQAWQRVENGTHTNVSIETLERIAAALEVAPDDLLSSRRRKTVEDVRRLIIEDPDVILSDPAAREAVLASLREHAKGEVRKPKKRPG